MINNISYREFNDTRCSNFRLPFENEEILYQTVSGIFLVGSLYVLIALITYECTSTENLKAGKRLRILCAFAIGTSVLHSLSEQFIIIYSGVSLQSCSTLMSVKSTLFNVAVSWNYIFLWWRQRTFYANSALRRLRKPWMEKFMWIILVVLMVNPFVMLIFQQMIDLFGMCNGVCVVLRVPFRKQIPLIILATSYSFIQVALIYCYLYPLYQYQKEQKQNKLKYKPVSILNKNPSSREISSQASSTSGVTGSNKLLNSEKVQFKLLKRMRTWLILSCICVASDLIIAMLIAVFLLIETPSSVTWPLFLFSDVSMFIDIICVVCCFSKHREMFFPFKKLFLKLS